MRSGIDSYCWHRYFGEVYPEQEPVPERRTVFDLIDTAVKLEVSGLSLESCFLPSLDEGFLRELAASLDGAGLERVLAWGHPLGLQLGKSEEAYQELRSHFRSAATLGARVMRVPCGNFRLRGSEPVVESLNRLTPQLKRLAAEAADLGLVIGLENHGDFLADEMIELIHRVDARNLGITLDTCNNLRLLEDTIADSVKMAPYAVATHLKDATATGIGSPRNWRTFFPSVGLGNGFLDIRRVLLALKDAGYDGLLCVELDILPPGRNEDQELADSIAWLRRTLPTLD
ncbi:MAG TPA: sugar phosphate isomerase/epimerase family protein, partial [Chloroflexota bacterium]